MKLMIEVLENEFDSFVKLNPTISYEVIENENDLIPQWHKDIVENRLNDAEDYLNWDTVKQNINSKWVIK